MTASPGLLQRLEDYRPSKSLYAWSCIGCIIGTLIVGFTWGGWMTARSAQEKADKAASSARAELAAAMCVNRFETAADVEAQLALLKKTDGWDQSSFIRKGGWTIAPDTKEAVTGAATLCAEQLMNAKIPEPKAPATAG